MKIDSYHHRQLLWPASQIDIQHIILCMDFLWKVTNTKKLIHQSGAAGASKVSPPACIYFNNNIYDTCLVHTVTALRHAQNGARESTVAIVIFN